MPGPVIRVRQGQTIHFTLINDGNMPHSIDFHAAQTPWNVNYQEVPAGKSFSFDWKANYPGVFMYHCGAPVVIYHMANGMYGAIIVDPANGWAPAQEYVLVQSEFSAFHVIGALFSDTYADGNPANHQVGNQTVTIPPGGGMVVEMTIPEAGLYPFVTHSFADVGKGAVGVLK